MSLLTEGLNPDDADVVERHEAAFGSMALGAGAHPDHVDDVLDEHAKGLADMDDKQLDAMSDAAHAENIRRIIQARPEWHVHYEPPSPTGPHADHQRPAKTFALGKPNSMTDAEARAEKRKRGIRY